MDEAPAAHSASTKKKSPLRYILLAVSLIVIGIVVFSIGVFSPKSAPKKDQPTVTAGPTPTPYAYTVLSFTPNPINMDGGKATAEVLVDPGKNEVTAVQLEVSYDPKVLSSVTIEPTKTFFSSPIVLINKNDKAAGHYTFALGITPAQQPVTKPGNVVKITVTKAPGANATQTTLGLTPETLVTSSGVGVSVLKSSSNLVINL